jgi:hypothetical protein
MIHINSSWAILEHKIQCCGSNPIIVFVTSFYVLGNSFLLEPLHILSAGCHSGVNKIQRLLSLRSEVRIPVRPVLHVTTTNFNAKCPPDAPVSPTLQFVYRHDGAVSPRKGKRTFIGSAWPIRHDPYICPQTCLVTGYSV